MTSIVLWLSTVLCPVFVANPRPERESYIRSPVERLDAAVYVWASVSVLSKCSLLLALLQLRMLLLVICMVVHLYLLVSLMRPKHLIWSIMRSSSIDCLREIFLTRFLLSCYNSTCVKWGESFSCPFSISNGVRQEGVLSPILLPSTLMIFQLT